MGGTWLFGATPMCSPWTWFEFPSLRKVLHTTFGDPYPGFPYPDEWLEEQATWSHHNIAFTRSGALLVGTPRGSLIEVDLAGERAIEHHVLAGQVGALTVLPSGQLVLADRTGQVTVMAAPGPAAPHDSEVDHASARERVAAFLATTSELPGDAEFDTELVRTDGVCTWDSDNLDNVTEADESDPTWLRLQAAINALGR